MIGDVTNLFTRGNIDPIIDRLPERLRDWVVWELRDGYGPEHGPADNYIILEGVTVARDHVEEYQRDRDRREADMRQVWIPMIRDWLARHPLLSRTELFPFELAMDLMARITEEVQTLHATRPKAEPGRRSPRWPQRRRWTSLAGLDHDLERAVERAKRGAIGSQDHALAWEGLERTLREVDGLLTMTEAERLLLRRPLQGEERDRWR